MSTSTWNGVTVPTAGDPWQLITDLKNAFDSADMVIPVSSQTVRDGLAALAPGGVLPVPTTVMRTDLAGYPLEVWNGSSWLRKGVQSASFNRNAGTDATFTTANTGLVSGTITGAPAGTWRIEALIGLYGSASAVGRVFVSTGSTPTYYKRRQDLSNLPATFYVSKPDFIHTGGDLVIGAGYDVASGTAAVMSAASGETTVVATFVGN